MLCIFQNSPKIVQYVVTELIVNLRVYFEICKRKRENKINVYFREIINDCACLV